MESGNNFSILQFTQRSQPSDRYLANTVREITLGAQKLQLICVIEIVDRWNHAREIGITLPDFFSDSLTSSSHRSILTMFEDTLKLVNSYLKAQQQKIGAPISCLVAIHHNAEVYFSTIGELKVLLLRDDKVSSLATNKNGLQEFGSVTSGTLSPSDWIFYVNKPLSQIVKEVEPASIMGASSSQLEQVIRNSTKMAEKTELTGCAVRYEDKFGISSVVYLDEKSSNNGAKTPEIKTSLNQGLITVVKLVNSSFSSLKRFVLNLVRTTPLSKKDRVNNTDVPVSHYTAPTLRKDQKYPSHITQNILRILKRLPRGVYALLIFLILASLLGGTAYHNFTQRRGTSPTSKVAEKPTLVNDLQKSSNPIQSRTLLATGLSLDRYQAFSTEEQKTLDSLAAQATVTIKPLPAPLFSIGADIAAVTIVPKTTNMYLVDKTNQLWFWDGKNATKVNQSGTVNTQQTDASQSTSQTSALVGPVSITALAKNVVVISDSQNNIFLYDGSATNPPTMLHQPASWASGPRYLQNYNGNLYVLTTNDGVVHRIPGFITDIANDVVVNKNNVSADDHLLSFLVNGDIVTLSTKVGLVDHPKTTAATVLIAPEQISNTSSACFGPDGIKVINNNLISSYNLQGVFQSGIALLTNSSITNIAIDNSDKTYITIGTNVYNL